MYTRVLNDLVVLANSKCAQSSERPSVQHREVRPGDVSHGFAQLQFIRDVVDGWWSNNDGGMNDFRLECESEARRPRFSPPGTGPVSEQSRDAPTVSTIFSMVTFRISRA